MDDYGDIKAIAELYTRNDYDWSIVGLWRGPEGYYLGTDSGCSCYTPWEYYKALEDLTGPLTAGQAREEITSLVVVGKGYCEATQEELDEFLAEVV